MIVPYLQISCPGTLSVTHCRCNEAVLNLTEQILKPPPSIFGEAGDDKFGGSKSVDL
jgi:hypothetical protein